MKAGASRLSDCAHIFSNETADARRTFDLVKQVGFDTDCCGDNTHWAIPADVIDHDIAALLTVPFSKGSISVQVRVTGDAISPAHLARVRKYLELAESEWDGDNE